MEKPVDGASASPATCRNCRFFDLGPDGMNGWCHLNPPVTLLLGMRQPMLQGQPPQPVVNSFWTPIGHNQWCGQHEEGPFPLVRDRTPMSDAARALASADIEGSA